MQQRHPLITAKDGLTTGRAPLKALDDGTAFGSFEIPTLEHGRKDEPIRHGAVQGLPAPILISAYLFSTLESPNRPAMFGLIVALFLVSGLSFGFARRIAASPMRGPLSAAGAMFYVIAASVLSYLDGGIASPIGSLPLFFLPFIATTLPQKILVWVVALAVAGFWSVTLTTSPVLAGRAALYSIAFVALTAICSAHSRTVHDLGKRLSRACRTDALSGCLNRRGLDEALLRAREQAGTNDLPVSFVAIDLDHFKAINDTFGHRAGDDAIAFAGLALREAAGRDRLVARAGGDEFVIALLGKDQQNAHGLSQMARATLAPFVSASVGVGRYPQDADTVSGALRIADLKTYEDKLNHKGSDGLEPVRPPQRPESSRESSRTERRGRSIKATASAASFNKAVGLSYVLTASQQNRVMLAALLVAGMMVSLTLLFWKSRIAQARHAGAIVNAVGMLLVANTAVITVLDGGVASPIAMGLLIPMMTVALTAPLRDTLAVVPILGATYIAIALLVGSPGFWYPLAHIAGILALAIAMAFRNQTSTTRRRALHDIGRFDALTQCLTRSAFEAELERRPRSNHDAGKADWLLVVDLDDFKSINDQFGHAKGDALLRWVADRFRSELRECDLLARFGGDEFVIALSCYSQEDAEHVVNRLAEVISDHARASFGLAAATDAVGIDELLSLADRRMYDQKLAHARHAEAMT